MKPPPDPLARLADHLERHPGVAVPAPLAAAVLGALRSLDGGALRRNQALRAIARMLDPDGTPWAQAVEVERALNRRELERQRAQLMGTACPSSPLAELLDAALDAPRPCRTPRGIWNALVERACSDQTPGMPHSTTETQG